MHKLQSDVESLQFCRILHQCVQSKFTDRQVWNSTCTNTNIQKAKQAGDTYGRVHEWATVAADSVSKNFVSRRGSSYMHTGQTKLLTLTCALAKCSAQCSCCQRTRNEAMCDNNSWRPMSLSALVSSTNGRWRQLWMALVILPASWRIQYQFLWEECWHLSATTHWRGFLCWWGNPLWTHSIQGGCLWSAWHTCMQCINE